MLINASYFLAGPRQIQNATCGTASTQVNDYILGWIAELQQEFLCKLLGESVGEQIHAYLCSLDEDPQAEADSDMEAVCQRIRHSYADYVFYQILSQSNTLASVDGLVELKNANRLVSPIVRQVQVWNRMVSRNKMFASWAASQECPLKGIVTESVLLTPINRYNL